MRCSSCGSSRAKLAGVHIMCEWCLKHILGQLTLINKMVAYLGRQAAEIERKRELRMKKFEEVR